jgi:hypothetical protein
MGCGRFPADCCVATTSSLILSPPPCTKPTSNGVHLDDAGRPNACNEQPIGFGARPYCQEQVVQQAAKFRGTANGQLEAAQAMSGWLP